MGGGRRGWKEARKKKWRKIKKKRRKNTVRKTQLKMYDHTQKMRARVNTEMPGVVGRV